MKKTFTFILLALFCICGYAQTIAPALLEEMGQRCDNEKIRVFVIMRQQYDHEQLCRRADYYTTRAERREFVVNELKQFADVSQYDIRQSLAEMERNEMITTPKILWIANALYFSATKQAIYNLAQRKDVEIIGFDEEQQAIPNDEIAKPATNTRGITQNVIQVGADQVWNLGYTGRGVVVAIIDSGVNYNHLDLADHLWDGGTEFPNHGYDLYDDDDDPMDMTGHGSHCAGIVCGDGTAGSQTGIAPDVELMCIKVLDDNGHGSPACGCDGIQWALEHGADVFSMSLSLRGEKVLFRNTCISALDAGMVSTKSAGNGGQSLSSAPIPENISEPGNCPPPYLDPDQLLNPGGLSCMMAIGAVDYDDTPAVFTSHGPVTWTNTVFGDYPYTPNSYTEFGLIRPDVCTPGVNIKSLDYSGNDGYCKKSGTSMAAPCAAGCIALMLSKNPNLTPADICRILEETSVQLTESKSNITGCGRVDALAAVKAVQTGPLSLSSYVINDSLGNNNHQLNAGESVTMDLTLNSTASLSGATMVLTTESQDVTITNGTLTLPDFTDGATQTISNFAFTVNNDVPAKRRITFFAEIIVNNETVGSFGFTLFVKGEIMLYENAIIVNDDNGNGTLDPGETADLRILINNMGNQIAPSVIGTLSSTSEYLTINIPSVSIGDIGVYEQTYVDFSVTLGSNVTNAFPIPCFLNLVDAEGHTSELGFSLFNIITTANLEEGGILMGGGTYGTGTMATLSAITDDNHTFISWKKGNSVVSYTDFNISVLENASYVANFDVISNVVPVGQAVTSSEFLPTYPYYNYSLTEQIYTVEELGEAFEISSIAFFNSSTTKTQNCRIYLKHTDKSAFQGGQDWEVVEEDDMLYEGDFTFNTGAWTTVYFDHAFAYDGIHNVVLVVDDNTGSWTNNYMYCRAYHSDSYQAIKIYNDDINYNPLNPSDYSGTLMSMKNQVLFGVASYNYTVTVSVDPGNGGMVSVDEGLFYYGQLCTVTATPSGDNVFYYWSENGTRVSTDATYSFRVTDSRQLVAHFGPPVTVTVVADPEEGGIVSGSGSFSIGEICTLTATSNAGYYFLDWTEDGIVVSYDNVYSFMVEEERNLVANFVEGELMCDIIFDLYDSYGDGWNGNYLVIDYGDGNQEQLTMESGSSASFVREVAIQSHITLTWVSGNYTGECSFDIRFGNGVPIYHGSGLSSSFHHEFTVNCAVVFAPCTISAVALPEEGGTIEGVGTYEVGTDITLTATPSEGYLFLHWKKGGEMVSCNATYSLTVIEDVEMEAVFMRIEGTLIGEGEATDVFLPSYSYYKYTLSQQIYTSEEIGGAGSITTISYFNAGKTKSRSYDIYMVHTDKSIFENSTDWIAVSESDLVYSGEVTMRKGYWTTIVLDTPFAYDGTSNLAIVIDDNSGDWTNSPHMACRVFEAQGNQTLCVYSDGTNYNPSSPSSYGGTLMGVKNQFILGILTTQAYTFSEGWNWFSTNVEITLDVLKATLMEALSGTNITVNSQTNGSTTYNGTMWRGTLNALDVTQMYMIQTSAACEITLTDMLVNPVEHPITIHNGINWIAFLASESMMLSNAFVGFAVNGDMVISQFSSATYNGQIWRGSLSTLEPGKGYMYKSSVLNDRTYTFPISTK